MDWLVKLNGEQADLEGLTSLLHTSKLTVLEEEESFYLRSSDFLPLESPDEVNERALAMIEVINEVLRMENSRYTGVTKCSVIRVDRDGNRTSVHCEEDPTKLGDGEEDG